MVLLEIIGCDAVKPAEVYMSRYGKVVVIIGH